jgi:DNA topoisomerase-2
MDSITPLNHGRHPNYGGLPNELPAPPFIDVETIYPVMTAEESVIQKDWAAGSAKQMDHCELIISKSDQSLTAGCVSIKYSPAWKKIIDEVIDNAVDHVIRCMNTLTPVTVIKIWFDRDGRIRVYNNGAGIPVVLHPGAGKLRKQPTYVPTFIFGVLFQGSNKTRATDCITGGANGMGAKLANIMSIEFIAETCDGASLFVQKWANHKQIEHPPRVIDLSGVHNVPRGKTIPHTILNFMPDYAGIFGYVSANGASANPQSIGVGSAANHILDDTTYQNLRGLLYTRACFVSAYLHYTMREAALAKRRHNPIEVWFNDEKITIVSIADIAAAAYPSHPRVSAVVMPDATKMPVKASAFAYGWEVCAVIAADTKNCTTSVVNGLMVRDGTHMKVLRNQIVTAAKDKTMKILHDKNVAFSPSYVLRNLVLFVNAKIPNPSWEGQRKDVPFVDAANLAGYIFDAKFLDVTIGHLRDSILETIFEKTEKHAAGKRISTYNKYKPAKYCGRRGHSTKCHLILLEGDSAKDRLETGISKILGWDYYGTICTGGVPINVREHCDVITTARAKHLKPSNVFNKNIFMQALLDIVGLNIHHRYEPGTPTYTKEMSELRYGCLVACVDQDLDGMGNILGSIMSMFDYLWPELLRVGFIKWLRSPIIRVYPKRAGIVQEFYDLASYNAWIAKTPNAFGTGGAYTDPKYYKGIGTHSREEIINVVRNYQKQLRTFTVDDRSSYLFDIYYGASSKAAAAKRKVELTKPTKTLSAEIAREQETLRFVSCSDHLEIETNLYQKDDLVRKLDHAIDGQNQAGRKILDGIIKALPGSKELRVDQLAGFISEHENYHHGAESLQKTITGKGLITAGGKQLPVIVPLSNFGSRKGGGDDASSARYIRAKLNSRLVNVLFPPKDYHLLAFCFDEGKRGEPVCFSPIVPMSILESKKNPAHGWKQKTWARCVFEVIKSVRTLIDIADDAKLLPSPPTSYKGAPYAWTGEFRDVRGCIHSFGRYLLDVDKNTILITELPLRKWTKKYLAKLTHKQQTDSRIIESFDPDADDLTIRITVQLRPGALDLLDTFADSIYADGIEEYFLLHDHMDSHINFIGNSGEVIMFRTYEEVIHYWFPYRKAMYGARLTRRRILLELNCVRLENIIKYIELSNEMVMSRRKEMEMIRVLETRGFAKLNHSRLEHPKFATNAELSDFVLLGDKKTQATYSYLLNLSDSKKSEESLAKYMSELDRLRQEISDLAVHSQRGRFPGSIDWLNELDALEKVIVEGQKTFWQFEEAGKFKFV